MKESIFDVLMYLFQNYMEDESEAPSDRESLHMDLLEAGFSPAEINKAFDWLDDLAEKQSQPQPKAGTHRSIRLFAEPELEKLDLECQGFLMYLEQAGVIGPSTRELILDRVMAFDSEEIDIERLKWIVLMVLFNQPGEETALRWIENMVFEDYVDYVH